MHRRHVLAGTAGLGLSGLAGCLGLLGDDLTEFEASPAGVDPDVRSDTGYEETGVEPQVIEEEFEAAGQSETVVVTNYVTEHEKAVDMGLLGQQEGAVFMVLATPQVSVLGREFNPVEEMTTTELVELVEENYDDIGNVEHDTDREAEVLDQETTESRFTADATFDGEDLEVYLHVTEAVETDDDLIVTIGVYPRPLSDQEEPNVQSLIEAVVEEPTTDDWGDGSDDGDSDDSSDDDDDGGDGEGDSDDGEGDDDADESQDDEDEDDGVLVS